jgi:hypothetical protein
MKDVDCPRCKAVLSGSNVSPCLCTVTADFCEDCTQLVLENYTCSVCSEILPARSKREFDVAQYAEIIEILSKKTGGIFK